MVIPERSRPYISGAMKIRENRSLARGRWTRVVLVLLTVGVPVLGGAAALPVLTGRTEAPRFSLEAAWKAVNSARDSGAIRWAPEDLLRAESALRAAMLEHRRQETRFVLLRNFAAARAGFRSTEEKARIAAEQAVRNREAADLAADHAIELAASAVEQADGYASSLHLEYGKRRLLQRSKIGLAEARHLRKVGEPESARDRASLAEKSASEVRAAAVAMAARYTDPERVRIWRRWVEEAIDQSRRSGGKSIVVFKENHALHLYESGRLTRTYRAEMGYNALQTKLRAGDGSTPEGRYRITAKKGPGQSTYYKALLLNYPNEEDRSRFERARRSGAIPRWATPGGLIEIHGEGGRGKDWTKGCVALENRDIDDLFARAAVGTPVTIVGSNGRGGVFTEMVRESQSSSTATAGTR